MYPNRGKEFERCVASLLVDFRSTNDIAPFLSIRFARLLTSWHFIIAISRWVQFANRANRVDAKIKINEVVNDAVLLKRAQKEISRLKQKLAQALEQANDPNSTSMVVATKRGSRGSMGGNLDFDNSRMSSASTSSKDKDKDKGGSSSSSSSNSNNNNNNNNNNSNNNKPPRTQKSRGKQVSTPSKNKNNNNKNQFNNTNSNLLEQSFGASMTEAEIQKLSSLAHVPPPGPEQQLINSPNHEHLFNQLENKFEKREAGERGKNAREENDELTC